MLIATPGRGRVRCPRWRGMSLGVLTAVAGAAGPAQAQERAYGFVYLIGTDTLGIERVSRPQPGVVVGDIHMRAQPRLEWTATLAGPGQATSLMLTAYRSGAADAPVLQRVSLTLDGDTVQADMSGPTGAATKQRIGSTRTAFLLMNASAAMIDLALDRARATPAPVDTIPVFLTTGGQTVQSILRVWGDSATWSIAGLETKLVLEGGRLREAFVAQQNLRMRLVSGAAYAALTLGAADYSAPADAPYAAHEVMIPATGGHELAATLTVPSAATGRAPAVVTITGSGPQDRDEYIPLVPGYRPFRQLADTLGRRGIATLRFDDRGTGSSTGSFAGATSADFANDVRSAVRWLRSRPDIDASKIFLVGHSEGGLIAPLVAADDGALAGIVLLAGTAKTGLDIITFQQRYAIEHDTSLAAPAKRDSAMRSASAAMDGLAKDPWMAFFLKHEPLEVARRVKTPTFVVQGASDQQVTADQADMLALALTTAGNRDVTVRVFPNLNHLFLYDPTGNPSHYTRLPSGRIGADVMGPVVDWLVLRATR